MPKFKETGKIDTVFLPELIINIYKEQKNGILTLNSASDLDIYFDKGRPFYAEGGDEDTLLLKILLDNDKITAEQYDNVVAQIDKTDMKVGEIIVNMGILNPHELNDYIELQINEKIISGLTFTKGEYNFEETLDFPSHAFYCRLNLQSIVFETLRRYVDFPGIEINNIKLDKHEGYAEKISKLNLGPKELRIAQLLNKNQRLSGIVKSENIVSEKLITLVFFLTLYGLLEIKDFSVKDYCFDSFRKLREQHKASGPAGDSEETTEIIELENEIDEEYMENAEEGVEIDTTQTVDQTGLQRNTISEGDIPQEREGIDINFDSPDEEDTAKPGQNIDEIPDETPDENQIDPGIDDQQEETVFSDNNETNVHTHDDTSHNASGVDPEPVSTDAEEPGTAEYEIEGDESAHQEIPEEKSVPDSHLNEITQFYEFVSEENNSFRILGIEDDADDSAVKEAYFILVKKFHPDANPNFPKDIRNKAEAIFTKVTQAYESIATEAKRENYNYLQDADNIKDRAQSIYEAEIMYNEGELLLRQRRYDEASHNFSKAVQLNPDEATYMGALTWSRFLAQDNKNKILKESIKELEKATSMNENIAENFYYLGSLYKHADNTKEAEKNFSKAVDIDPHYIQAKRELRLLRNRKSDSGKVKSKEKNKDSEGGFWTNLFKK